MWGVGKSLSKAAQAQIRQMIREEANAEIKAFLTPGFIDSMTTGRAQLEELFDIVVGYEDRLSEVERHLAALQKVVVEGG